MLEEVSPQGAMSVPLDAIEQSAAMRTEILGKIRKRQSEGLTVAYVGGIFNVIHPGHLRIFKFAAQQADLLVLGLYDDCSAGTLITAGLRYDAICSLDCVDYAIIVQRNDLDFLKELKPNFVIKGKEHESSHNPELEVLEEFGGKLLFSSGNIQISSADFIKLTAQHTGPAVQQATDYLKRHELSFSSLQQVIAAIQGKRVCIVGDTIIDEYVACNPLGMSQEDPTLVVSPVSRERFLGGAAIVASHARGLGAEVEFFSVLGRDSEADFAREKLGAQGIHAHLVEDPSRPTTLKCRYRAKGKTLLRVNRLHDSGVSKELMSQIYDGFVKVVERCDLVLFSDFNYGCLPQALVDKLSALCMLRKLPMFADSQSSSQVGDVSRFRGMEFLTPTEREARLAMQDTDSTLAMLAQSLSEKAKSQSVILTLAEEGCLIYYKSDGVGDWKADRLPALNIAYKDASGAGDSLFVTAALARASGAGIWSSAYLGALAAAYQVSRVGNIAVSSSELAGLLGE